uniref:Trafficking protein particle complex subunit 13 n=2 Tax=Panagrolaimus sp. JU765 TaxID=591449 RepID=A0AC34R6R2_9BILA
MTDKMSTSSLPDVAVNKDQLLSLKVMRMSRPTFNDPVCMGIDPADSFSADIEKAMVSVNGCDSMELPVGQYLMAPQTIENIYLGETFNFYVVVLNDSDQVCSDVLVKADLQTQSQRINLQPKLGDSSTELAPGKCFGQIITHEIKEVGQHILICAVNYRTPDGEKMYFRKFFKFPVNKPIDVRTKFYNAEDNLNNDVYLEAQIQNLCVSSIVLEKVVMEPSETYLCREIKPTTNDEQGNIYLQPKAVRQYLFCLSPLTLDSSLTNYRGVSSIGKLDMCWRSTMGEKGRLQTSSLQRMAPGYGDLRLSIEQIPGMVSLLQPFVVTCKLYNCCERSLDLVLSFDGSLQSDVVYCSTSGQHLGQVAPSKSVQFTITLFATTPGMHFISGIRVTDTFLRRTYEHDDVAQFFVI